MAFLSRFFSRAQQAPLPSMEELFAELGIPPELEGLEDLKGDFEHLDAAERRHWAEALAELIAKGQGMPPLWLDAQYDLLPQVVPHWQAEREGYLFKPLFEGLCQRILACGQLVPRPWLVLWGVTEEDLEERALAHLLERSKGKPFRRLAGGIYQSAYGDGLDASRILLPELWEDLFPGQNTFVVVPTQDCLLVAPQVLLPKLVEAIPPALAAQGSRISATIYQRLGHEFLPANLQDPHPIAQPQRELRQSDLLVACQTQDQDLPAALGQPAGLMMVRTQQGRSLLVALWKEGAPCLLPDTDLVGFLSAKGHALGIYFRQTLPRISEVRGESVEFWGPRRTRYTGFPTVEQLERLEPFATPEQMVTLLKGLGNPPPPGPPRATAPSSGASSSPVPEHLRGLSLGPVRED